MYSPNYYKELRAEPTLQLIEDYGFATLLSQGDELSISHLPMMLSQDAEGKTELLSHMARANPHWRELQRIGRGMAIFQGPHAYISPAWYTPEPGNVPTWNYAVVHVTGVFEIIDDSAGVLSAMQKLVQKFETDYGTGWVLPETNDALAALMRGIVVFRLKDLQFEAKFKLSQKQTPVNRANTIEALKQMPGLEELAKYMADAT